VFIDYECDTGMTGLGLALQVFSKGDAGRARQCHACVDKSHRLSLLRTVLSGADMTSLGPAVQ